jgi:hypothetical protein
MVVEVIGERDKESRARIALLSCQRRNTANYHLSGILEGWKLALDRTILHAKLVQLLVDKTGRGGQNGEVWKDGSLLCHTGCLFIFSLCELTRVAEVHSGRPCLGGGVSNKKLRQDFFRYLPEINHIAKHAV